MFYKRYRVPISLLKTTTLWPPISFRTHSSNQSHPNITLLRPSLKTIPNQLPTPNKSSSTSSIPENTQKHDSTRICGPSYSFHNHHERQTPSSRKTNWLFRSRRLTHSPYQRLPFTSHTNNEIHNHDTLPQTNLRRKNNFSTHEHHQILLQ